MTKQGKRLMLAVVLGGILIAALAGWLIWNQPHRSVEDEKAIRIPASALQQAYAANETSANAQYLDKVIEVSGTVAGTEKNQDGKTVLYLDDALNGVGCTLRDTALTIEEEKAVVVKGFCSGSNGMGVALRECVLIP